MRLVLLLSGMLVMAADDALTTTRLEYRQALAATVDTADSEALRGYVLYPYLQAVRLQRALALRQPGQAADDLDARITAFIQAHANQPVVRELRRAWLLDLAGRRQWDVFLTHLPPVTTDNELRCAQATALLESPGKSPSLAALLPTLWMTGNRLPERCNAPFAWGRGERVLTPELIERRAKLALQAGNASLARDLADLLEPAQAEPVRQWAILIEKPQQAVDALIANPGIQVGDEALQDGWLRLARKDVDAALVRFASLQTARKLTVTSVSPYARSLALTLSWSRRSEALRYFAQVLPADRSELAQEWHARAAMWAGDWALLKQVIVAMPESLRSQARWRYWLARAHQSLNEPVAARAVFEALVATEDNYYAAMAAARLGVRYAPHPQAILAMVNPTELAQRVEAQRMRELLLVGQRSDAGREWTAVASGWTREEQQSAVRLMATWGWHEQAIVAAARLGLFNDYALLYPRPYDDAVRAAAAFSDLTEDMIYAQMRQESLYQAEAVSSANARGLMQMLLATARSTAREYRQPTPQLEDLFKPMVNVKLGAAHMKSLRESFDGQYMVALAAYNAGPGAARRWLPDRVMDSDVWIENIPYNETRTYVQRILWHSLVFHWLRVDSPVDAAAWLATVKPRTLDSRTSR